MSKDQIFVAVSDFVPQKALEYAQKTALAYEKEICLIPITDNSPAETLAQKCSETTGMKVNFLEGNHAALFSETLEKEEAAMVVFEVSDKKPFSNISYLLKISRDLRIPYIFVKTNFPEIKFHRVIVPITFLTEEREKGMFASAFGRFFKSEILLMPAKDYGSKAAATCRSIKQLLNKHDLNHSELTAQKDSYKVEMDAVMKAKIFDADIAIITASREYGLDDIIFGPKELHIIKKSEIPLMVLNPRGDLYVLCY